MLLSLSLLLAGLLPPQEPESAPEPAPPGLRVLFLGDQATATNDLPRMVAALAGSARLPLAIEVASRTPDDCTLERHWIAGRSTELLREGGWDVVVLQEHDRVAAGNPLLLLRNGRLLSEEARRFGARPVIFLPWSRTGDEAELAAMEETCRGLAEQAGAVVAPVGRAWQELAAERPAWRLRRPNGARPTRLGSYLSACVLLGWVAGLDPRALADERAAEELLPDDLRFLHEFASRFVPPEVLLPMPLGLRPDKPSRRGIGRRWDRPEQRPDAWRIERRPAEGGEARPYQEVDRLRGSSTRWADTAVEPGAAWAYRVWAVPETRRLVVPASGEPVTVAQALAPGQRCEVFVLDGRVELKAGENEESLAAGEARVFPAPPGGVFRAVATAGEKSRLEVSVLPPADRVAAIPPLVAAAATG